MEALTRVRILARGSARPKMRLGAKGGDAHTRDATGLPKSVVISGLNKWDAAKIQRDSGNGGPSLGIAFGMV